MERIVAIPSRATGTAASTSLTDCNGATFPISTALGGAPLITTGPFTGSVDFSKPAVANYSMQYAVCATASTAIYDVRWRVDPGPTPFTQLVTVAVKNAGPQGGSGNSRFALPVSLRTIRGAF